MTDTNPVGRPMKYTHEEKIRILGEMEKYLERCIKKDDRPAVGGFCVEQGISRQRIFEWAKDKNLKDGEEPLGEYFSELIQRIHEAREDFLDRHAILGNIPPSFAAFALKQSCIGWTDKSDIGLSGGMRLSIGLPKEFATDGT